MGTASLKVLVEIKITTITCPHVYLDPSKWINLRISLLGYHLRSRLLKPKFPLLVNENWRFERTFPLCSTASHLYLALARERVSIEMVQICRTEDRQIAIFHSNLNDILFGSPHIIKEKETRLEYISMILHTTQHFPGLANPHMNAVVAVRLMRINDPAMEVLRDGGHNVTFGLRGHELHSKITWHNPQLNQINCCSRNQPCEGMLDSRNSKITPPRKTKFVVRKVDEKLIGRQPSLEYSLPFQGFNQNLKSRPWYKSTSQLRRKPKISRSTHSLGPQLPIDNDCWCGEMKSNRNEQQTQEIDTPRTESAYQQTCEKDHWKMHNSDDCLMCKLYNEYFGSRYPRHSI